VASRRFADRLVNPPPAGPLMPVTGSRTARDDPPRSPHAWLHRHRTRIRRGVLPPPLLLSRASMNTVICERREPLGIAFVFSHPSLAHPGQGFLNAHVRGRPQNEATPGVPQTRVWVKVAFSTLFSSFGAARFPRIRRDQTWMKTVPSKQAWADAARANRGRI
jgi:hypothetical protein